jgi:hypothetical protein
MGAIPSPSIKPTKIVSYNDEHLIRGKGRIEPMLPPVFPPFNPPPLKPLPVLPHPPIAYSFTCQSLPVNYTAEMTCSGVVDYPFYVEAGDTIESMEADIRRELVNVTLQVQQKCLTAIKRVACAKLYKPCVPGGRTVLCALSI